MTAIPEQMNFGILSPPLSFYLPHILYPTRVTGHSKTLIDNRFSNLISNEAIFGNLTSTISDHLPQFLNMPSIFSDLSSSKSNVYERNW